VIHRKHQIHKTKSADADGERNKDTFRYDLFGTRLAWTRGVGYMEPHDGRKLTLINNLATSKRPRSLNQILRYGVSMLGARDIGGEEKKSLRQKKRLQLRGQKNRNI